MFFVASSAELVLVVVVREQELDALEAGLGRGREAIEKAHLVEHHGQVGVELRHAILPLNDPSELYLLLPDSRPASL